MAENKTKPTNVSVSAFLNQIEDERRRKDCRELVTLMRSVTGQPPRMWGTSIVGFDRYHYKYESGREGESLITGFASRRQDLVLYLGPGVDNKALISKLGKHRAGKGCLYLKRLDDVDRAVLRSLVEASVAAMRARYPRA